MTATPDTHWNVQIPKKLGAVAGVGAVTIVSLSALTGAFLAGTSRGISQSELNEKLTEQTEAHQRGTEHLRAQLSEAQNRAPVFFNPDGTVNRDPNVTDFNPQSAAFSQGEYASFPVGFWIEGTSVEVDGQQIMFEDYLSEIGFQLNRPTKLDEVDLHNPFVANDTNLTVWVHKTWLANTANMDIALEHTRELMAQDIKNRQALGYPADGIYTINQDSAGDIKLTRTPSRALNGVAGASIADITEEQLKQDAGVIAANNQAPTPGND